MLGTDKRKNVASVVATKLVQGEDPKEAALTADRTPVGSRW
jgi:hypothetical protein